MIKFRRTGITGLDNLMSCMTKSLPVGNYTLVRIPSAWDFYKASFWDFKGHLLVHRDAINPMGVKYVHV